MTTPASYNESIDETLDDVRYPELGDQVKTPSTIQEAEESAKKHPIALAKLLFTSALRNQIQLREAEHKMELHEARVAKWKKEAASQQEQVVILKQLLETKNELLEAQRQLAARPEGQTRGPERPEAETRSLQRTTPIRQSTPSSVTSERHDKRSAKYPDPPVLEDGIKPTIKIWSSLMANKLRRNADWYAHEDPIEEERNKVEYIQTRVDGKAAEHLYPWLEAKADQQEEVFVERVIQFLGTVFDDPDRRLKARQELKKMKMAFLGDFNDFQSDFLRLATIARTPPDQWKEEFHDKLFDSLKLPMEIYVADEDYSFEQYCKKAQQYARGLANQGKERQERRLKKRSAEVLKERKEVKQTSFSSSSKPKAAAASPAAIIKDIATITCFTCGKKGHYSTDCKAKPTETKVLQDLEDSEGFHSASQSGNESL